MKSCLHVMVIQRSTHAAAESNPAHSRGLNITVLILGPTLWTWTHTHTHTHTPNACSGDLAATVRSVQTVDQCLGELLATADEVNARYLVTSDHGNADDMVQRDKKGKPLVGMCVCWSACGWVGGWVHLCKDW